MRRLTAHLLILLYDWQIRYPNEQQRGDRHEGNDHLREPAPDAKIHFHPPSLSRRAGNPKRILLSQRKKRLILGAE